MEKFYLNSLRFDDILNSKKKFIYSCKSDDYRVKPKVLLIILFLLGITAFSPINAQLPDEFQQVPLLTGLSNATSLEFAPDGRIFLLDRYGEIIIYKTDTQTSVSAGTIPVYHEFEDGLLAMAFDPNFTTNNFIYVYYSLLPESNAKNRVSRFTMNGDAINLSSEVAMLEWDVQRTLSFHAGGDMDFDSQGNLYISVGDNTDHGNYGAHNETDNSKSAEKSSGNTNDYRGKILRITPQPNGTYTIPAGNLFSASATTLPEIYVMGARNPYRIFVDKENTDWLFWGEVGPDANAASALGPAGYDEINLVKQAGNFGWPYFSGANEAFQVSYRTPSPFYNNPTTPENTSTWNTGDTNLPPAQPSWLNFGSESYLAGPRYYYDGLLTDQQRFPVEFDEIFFYYDFNTSQIWAVTMDVQGNVITNEQFAPSEFPVSPNGFLDMEMGPDGKMYILAYGAGCCPSNVGTGKLIRVDYTGITTNAPPTVMIAADPTSGSLPLTVNFSSAGTSDPNGDSPLTYEWDFDGNGTVDSTAENPTFIYNTAGTFNVQLKVDDGNGGIGVNNITIYAGNNAANFTFNSPLDGGFIGWGDDINFDLTVTDVEDGAVDCNNVNLTPSLGHLGHFHDLGTQNGCPKTMTIDEGSHDADGEMDIFYVLNTNYTDTGGLSAFDQILLHPKRKEAEFFDTQNGVAIIPNTDPLEGGSEAIQVDNNGYVSFTGRNLSNITGVKYKVASAAAGGDIEFRVGSPTGALLATTSVPNTGGVNDWIAIESTFTDPGGKNDLFFVFNSTSGTQDIFNLNYVEFLGNGVSTDNSAPLVNSVESIGTTQVQVQFSEYVSQITAEQVSNYSIDNGITVSAAVLQSDDLTVLLTVSPLSSNTTYNLTVSNVENQSGIPVVTSSYPFSIVNSIRINVGGPQLIYGADTYIADQYSTGGSLFSPSIPIAGTNDDELYQTERFGNFSYEIPVPVSGEYDIRLHFAELFFGVGSQPGGSGSRVFNVTIEGNPVLTNFDILAETDPATALQKELDDISITDGFASIQLTSVVENPKLSAIEILSPDTFASTPDITITSPQNGWNVNQSFEVAFFVENWTIQEGDTHIHWYEDDVMIGPYYSHDPIPIDGLSIGSHTIRVELFYADHTPTGIFDEVMVAVTDQPVCNETDFPDSWVVHQLEQNPYTAVYTFAKDDLDGDGLKDIVTGGWWYKNTGSASGSWPKSTIGGTFGNVVHVYDFDNDGDMDLLGTALGIAPDNEYESVQLLWAQNDGSGNFTVFTNIPAGSSTYSEPFLAGIAGGDFGTGTPYQMAINWNGAESTGSPVQLLTPSADPTTGTWTLVNISPDSAGEDLQAGDIDGDGDLDLFQGINWLRNNGGGTWETFSTGVTYDTTPDRAQLADFDQDGDLDAVVGQLGVGGSGTNKSEFAWFAAPADPTQTWVRNILPIDVDGSLSVFAIDFDFDGDKDIVVGEWRGSYRLIVFENDLCSTGDWETQIINDGALNLEHHDGARVVDIDNDGDLDVISNGWLNHMIPRIYENTTPLPVSDDPIVDAGEDQTILPTTAMATLNGTASDPDGGAITAYQWTQISGPSTATLVGDTTPDLTASGLVLGDYVFRLTATDDENDTGFDEVTITVTDQIPAIRINSGGPFFTFNSIDWSADQYNVGGAITTNPIAIANTSNDELYQTERYHSSGTLVYEIPVSDGTYDLNLHFAEIFHGVPGAGSGGGVGSRIFNIDIENGQEQINNYDIIELAGGSATAIIENFAGIVVDDGNLTITLTSVVDFPKISGIEVLAEGGSSNLPIADAGPDRGITLPNSSMTLDGSGTDPDGGTILAYQWTQVSGPNTATISGQNTDDLDISDLTEGIYVFELTVTDDENEMGSDQTTIEVFGEPQAFRINSGGPDINFMGEEWSADQYFVNGGPFESVIPIANTENDELYQTERFTSSSSLTYEIPVINGDHNVSLHFAEIYFGVPGAGSDGGIGSRVFNVDIENGQGQLNNYDIVVAAGGSATAVVESFSGITINDGNLTIVFTPITNNPKISGIEVFETRPPNVDAGIDQAIELPTNNTVLTGTADDPDGGTLTYQWTQVSGPNTATLAGDTTLDLTANDLAVGEYVFRLTITDDENEMAFDEVTVTVNPEGGNMPPVAVAEAAPLTGAAPLEVTFTGSNSTDDVGVVSYAWDFGDGNSSTEPNPIHTYDMEGTYTVTLTVTDSGGLTNVATLSISVGNVTGKMEVILDENPAKDGFAKIRVLNAPSDMMVLNIYLHDVGGRYISGHLAADVLSTNGTYDIPISTLRDGLYFVGVGMNQGKPRLIKLIIDN